LSCSADGVGSESALLDLLHSCMATVNLVRIAHILTALDFPRSSKMSQIKSKAAIPYEELLFRSRRL
jgi:hypothetical protein